MEGRALVCCARTHMRLQQSTSAVRELHFALKIGKDVGSSALVEEVRRVVQGPLTPTCLRVLAVGL